MCKDRFVSPDSRNALKSTHQPDASGPQRAAAENAAGVEDEGGDDDDDDDDDENNEAAAPGPEEEPAHCDQEEEDEEEDEDSDEDPEERRCRKALAARVTKIRKGFSMARFYKPTRRTPPIWQTPEFIAEFCDPFLGGGMQGNPASALRLFTSLLRELADHNADYPAGVRPLPQDAQDAMGHFADCLNQQQRLFRKVLNSCDVSDSLVKQVGFRRFRCHTASWVWVCCGMA